jgi:tetratricopeptide (TPR) repeat protein
LCLSTGTSSRIGIVACNDNGPPTDGMWRNPPKAPAGPVFVGGRMLGSAVQASGSSTAPTVGAQAPGRNVDRTVPAPPPEPCIPNPALREASNGQVEAGNAAIVSSQLGEALDRYRAALSMNQCNAYAWTALGDALLQTGDSERARAALVVATRLMPAHFHAWTSLGQAEERLGDRTAARRAYQQALAAKPGYAPAAAGLSRIGG